jgi:hypothetical protein
VTVVEKPRGQYWASTTGAGGPHGTLFVPMPGSGPLIARALSLLLLLAAAAPAPLEQPPPQHPRLFFSAGDLGRLRERWQSTAYMRGVLRQYEAALDHQLNYTEGGASQDISKCSNCFEQMEVATALYMANHSANASLHGDLAKGMLLAGVKEAAAIPGGSFVGAWFAATQRNLQNLVIAYDIVHDRMNASEAAQGEAAFASIANRLMITCNPASASGPAPPPYNATGFSDCYDIYDTKNRLSNWATDRYGALLLIALTFPDQPNATRWREHALHEFRWQIANGITADGQWNEASTRYHGAVLRCMISLSYALRHAKIMDAFQVRILCIPIA